MTKEELLKQQKEIEQQLKNIEDAEYNLRIENNRIRLDELRKNKDNILAMFEHDRTSCSDSNVSNGYGSASYGARCNKCHLIEILNSDYDNEFSVDFNISISRICKR